MGNTKLILVEGIPGTGKSSTAQLIDRCLRLQSSNVLWYHEDSSEQPIRLFFDPTRHFRWSDYTNEAEHLWRQFARSLSASDSVAVFDASILQNHVRSLLLFGCDVDPIIDLVLRIESIVRPLSPTWIYLKPNSVEVNFRRLVRTRGEQLLKLWIESQSRFPFAIQSKQTGLAGFVEFWNQVELVAQQIFDRLTIAKTQINVTGDNWNNVLDPVEQFFKFERRPQYPRKLNLNDLKGTYSCSTEYSQSEIAIKLIGESITVICSKPTFDPASGPFACFHEVQLTPIDLDLFSVLGWPHMVTVIRDSDSQISGLHVCTQLDGWQTTNQHFRRKR